MYLPRRYHYEIVCEQTGQSTRLHELENSKRSQSQLVAAVDLCDGQETELLLCYNRKHNFFTDCFLTPAAFTDREKREYTKYQNQMVKKWGKLCLAQLSATECN